MTTIEIEIAVMEHFGIRQNLIVPNISWGIAGLHECDILSLNRTGYATEVEIKTSKADLLQDKKKKHNHRHNHIADLYFAVPENLRKIALEVIPERAGLFIIKKYEDNDDYFKVSELTAGAYEVKPSTRNKDAVKWTEKERYQLARLGTMRILALKKKLK